MNTLEKDIEVTPGVHCCVPTALTRCLVVLTRSVAQIANNDVKEKSYVRNRVARKMSMMFARGVFRDFIYFTLSWNSGLGWDVNMKDFMGGWEQTANVPEDGLLAQWPSVALRPAAVQAPPAHLVPLNSLSLYYSPA